MAAFFTLKLDTLAPQNGSISIVSLTNTRSITVTVSATDATQMKFWGDIESAANESAASWETYVSTKVLSLSGADGVKTVYVKFRDSVGNETTTYSATTNLDTTGAVVTITGPDVDTISKVNGYNVAAFSFSVDTAFVAWEVRVVPASESVHTAGTVIGTTNGSTNMSGEGGAANTAINCTINGADLEAASSGDGAKIIKVFVKDAAGNWSV